LTYYETIKESTVKNSAFKTTSVVLLLKETQIQTVVDTAEEIGGKVRVVKKPRITGNKRKRKTDLVRDASSGEYVAHLTSLKQL